MSWMIWMSRSVSRIDVGDVRARAGWVPSESGMSEGNPGRGWTDVGAVIGIRAMDAVLAVSTGREHTLFGARPSLLINIAPFPGADILAVGKVKLGLNLPAWPSIGG